MSLIDDAELMDRVKTIEDVLQRFFYRNSHQIVGGEDEAMQEVARLSRYWREDAKRKD